MKSFLVVLLSFSFVFASWIVLVDQRNLKGFSLACEDLVGLSEGSLSDVALQNYWSYSVLYANVQHKKVFVNAIGFKLLPYVDGKYRLRVEVQLPSPLPKPDVNQKLNPELIHVCLWMYKGDKWERSFPLFWYLNPWTNTGKIYVYHDNLQIQEVGYLAPNTNINVFEIVGDFNTETWVSAKVNGQPLSVSRLHMNLRFHPDWGANWNVWGSVEVANCYPEPNMAYVFYYYIRVWRYQMWRWT